MSRSIATTSIERTPRSKNPNSRNSGELRRMTHPTMQSTTPKDAGEQELTDGFHLLIDALKLTDINTIYGVPGTPITDYGRMAQASAIRVLSFRHEQNAGYA